MSSPSTSRPAKSAGAATERTSASERKTAKLPVPMAYCTPLLLEIDGRTQLALAGQRRDRRPTNRKPAKRFGGSAMQRLFERLAPGDGSRHAVPLDRFRRARFFTASRPAATGDVTESNAVWKNDKASVVPMDVSPLVVGDEFYTISDAGRRHLLRRQDRQAALAKTARRQVLGLPGLSPTAGSTASTTRARPSC